MTAPKRPEASPLPGGFCRACGGLRGAAPPDGCTCATKGGAL